MRWLDGITYSVDRNLSRLGGVQQSMQSQRVRHDLVTEHHQHAAWGALAPRGAGEQPGGQRRAWSERTGETAVRPGLSLGPPLSPLPLCVLPLLCLPLGMRWVIVLGEDLSKHGRRTSRGTRRL